MHVEARKVAVSGIMLALTVLCILMGGVIEFNTLFLLAAASFFVGIVYREFGAGSSAAFLIAAVLLGLFLAPNKLYVLTYGAMSLYIFLIELIQDVLKRKMEHAQKLQKNLKEKKYTCWLIKYSLFNLLYIPAVLGFQKFLFAGNLRPVMKIGVIAAGQIGLYLYDRAYAYVQIVIWKKLRLKLGID